MSQWNWGSATDQEHSLSPTTIYPPPADPTNGTANPAPEHPTFPW